MFISGKETRFEKRMDLGEKTCLLLICEIDI